MNTTSIPGRASDAGPALPEDTRDWLELALNARDAVERATSWKTDKDTVAATKRAKSAELREAIDYIQLALDRL